MFISAMKLDILDKGVSVDLLFLEPAHSGQLRNCNKT